ncbi:MAG: DoxX family membrane protein [Nanoarchaeota archaeon]
MKFADYHDHAIFLLRICLGGIFLWFGIHAILNPAEQFNWMAKWVQTIPVVGTPTFVFLFGIVETFLGTLLVLGIFIRLAALATALSLISIIINLGWGEIAFRDVVIFMAALTLATQPKFRWAIYPYFKKDS